MEMLVTKFSKGKYRNEGELFSEPISKENVKLMGEMIALQLFRTRKKHYCRIADKLYPKHTGKERVMDIVYKVDTASVLRYKLNNPNK